LGDDKKEDCPYDLIDLAVKNGKAKQWRLEASKLFIELWQEKKYRRWLMAGLYAFDMFIAGLLLKLIFG